MVKSWDGTLSSADFCTAASVFSEQWSKFNSHIPQWIWVPSRKRPWVSHSKSQEGYLSLSNVMLPCLSDKDHIKGEESEKEECTDEYEDEFVDAAAVHYDIHEEHRYDFHAVYSASYRVPVLYFRAYCSDGQPLSLDYIEKDISDSAIQQLTKSKWTFITQEEHPELNRPWFTLHPCGTSEWMKLLLSSDASSSSEGTIPMEKYLVSWFSVVGQVFGLKIPYEMLNVVDVKELL